MKETISNKRLLEVALEIYEELYKNAALKTKEPESVMAKMIAFKTCFSVVLDDITNEIVSYSLLEGKTVSDIIFQLEKPRFVFYFTDGTNS